MKVHREHYDKNEEFMAYCKGIFFFFLKILLQFGQKGYPRQFRNLFLNSVFLSFLD